jgi:hypothetical protein
MNRLGALLAVAGIVATLAAPRTTHQPTVELGSSGGTTAGAGDTSLTVNLGASAVGSSSVSFGREFYYHFHNQPSGGAP